MEDCLLPQNYKDYIVREYSFRKSRRPAYSKRAFARDLGISPSTLVDFLNGKSTISIARLMELSNKLKLDTRNKEHWIDLYTIAFSKKASEKKLAKSRILTRSSTIEQKEFLRKFKIASEPIYWIYSELLTINPKMQSIPLAASALGISETKLKNIIADLMRLGFLTKSNEGILSPNDSFRIFGDGRPSKTLRHFHKKMLNKAVISLENQSTEDRFNCSVIFSIPKSKLKEMIYKLEKANYQVLTEYSDYSAQDSVYGFSFSLFNLLENTSRR